MKQKIALVFLFLFSFVAFVYAGGSDTVYRSITSADSASPAVIPLSDQQGIADTYIQINAYGGENGGDLSLGTPFISFDLEICHDATATDDTCENPTYAFSGQQAGSAGIVLGPYNLYGFVGIRADSVTILGTDSPAFRVYLKRKGG